MAFTGEEIMKKVLKRVGEKNLAPGIKETLEKCIPNSKVERDLFAGRHIRFGNQVSEDGGNKLLMQSLSKEPAQNDNKEIHNMPRDENMQSIVGESRATSKSHAFGIISNDNQQEPSHSESTLAAQEIKECHRQKRKGDVLEDEDSVSEVAQTTGSSEIKRSEGSDVNSSLEHTKNSRMERENTRDSIPPCRNWKDVFTKFLDDSRKISSPLIDKLDMRMIGVLDEMSVYILKVKKYELLRSDIQDKKAEQSSQCI